MSQKWDARLIWVKSRNNQRICGQSFHTDNWWWITRNFVYCPKSSADEKGNGKDGFKLVEQVCFFYHFWLLCACVNEPVFVTPRMLPIDQICSSEHARTTINWYYHACSELQKRIDLEQYQKWVLRAILRCIKRPVLVFKSMLGEAFTGGREHAPTSQVYH